MSGETNGGSRYLQCINSIGRGGGENCRRPFHCGYNWEVPRSQCAFDSQPTPSMIVGDVEPTRLDRSQVR